MPNYPISTFPFVLNRDHNAQLVHYPSQRVFACHEFFYPVYFGIIFLKSGGMGPGAGLKNLVK